MTELESKSLLLAACHDDIFYEVRVGDLLHSDALCIYLCISNSTWWSGQNFGWLTNGLDWSWSAVTADTICWNGLQPSQGKPWRRFSKRRRANPGIKLTWFIFKHTFINHSMAFYSGQTLKVPDQVIFHMRHSCVKHQSTNTYKGQKSYQKQLSVNIEASGMQLFELLCTLEVCIATMEPCMHNFMKPIIHSIIFSLFLISSKLSICSLLCRVCTESW